MTKRTTTPTTNLAEPMRIIAPKTLLNKLQLLGDCVVSKTPFPMDCEWIYRQGETQRQ